MSTAEDFPVGTRVRFGTSGRGVVADPDNPLTLAPGRTYRPEDRVYVWNDEKSLEYKEYDPTTGVSMRVKAPQGTWWRPESLQVDGP
jgi:hypothetical protein